MVDLVHQTHVFALDPLRHSKSAAVQGYEYIAEVADVVGLDVEDFEEYVRYYTNFVSNFT